MKKLISALLCLGILLTLYIPAVSSATRIRTYYVDVSVSESGNGTARSPFKTVSEAKAAAAAYVASPALAHDRVEIRLAEGTYIFEQTEVFTSDHGGTSECEVSYIAEGDVIFTGNDGSSVLDGSLIFIDGASGITFECITFSDNMNAPLVNVNGSDITFESCTFADSEITGSVNGSSLLYALSCTGDNITVDSCEFYDVTGGISLCGGDRVTLTGASSSVRSCHIHNYNSLRKADAAAISVNGVGHTVANNEIYADSGIGIAFTGNSHRIEYNKIFSATVGIEGYGSMTHYGSSVRHNFVSGPSKTAIDLKDGVSGATVYGNVIHNGLVGVNLDGGRDITVENNIFFYDSAKFTNVSAIIYGSGIRDEVLYNNGLREFSRDFLNIDYTSGVWRERYPELSEVVVPRSITSPDDPDMFYNPAGSSIKTNAIYISRDIKKVSLQFAGDTVNGIPYQQRYGEFCDNVIMPRDDFSDFSYLAIEDFTMSRGASLFTVLKDFKMIPFGNIGCTVSFIDVAEGNWTYPWVKYACLNGIMAGTNSDGTVFSPDGTTSRSMMVQILYNLEGRPTVEFEDIFTDVSEGDWYAPAVIWAYREGITSGTSESTFSPNAPVTREQMAVLLFRYITEYKGISQIFSGSLISFPDKNDISPYAGFTEAVSWAVSRGIITGKEKGGKVYLSPLDVATRGECAAMMSRLHIGYEF